LGVAGPGWLLLIYLICAQGISAFDYEMGVAMGAMIRFERLPNNSCRNDIEIIVEHDFRSI
jgi:hypothetical protein